MGNNPIIGIDADGRFFDPVTWGIIIGAAVGAYGGGAYANDGELDPTKWDYQNGGTWGGMIGGGVIGGFAGGHMAFQMFGSSVQGATGVTFQGTVYSTAEGVAAGANASVVAGGASSGAFSYGAFAAYTAGIGLTAFAGYNYYNHGLGTPGQELQTHHDFTAGTYFTAGFGRGPSMPIYSINSNAAAGYNNYAYSATWGQMYNWNSATGEITRQGMFGFRLGNISASYHNDAFVFPSFGGGTDQGWTGGLTISALDGNGMMAEWNYQSFTGIKMGDDYTYFINGREYYQQKLYQQSLNKAITSTSYLGNQYHLSRDGWFQHSIHDWKRIPRFYYP
ncbi:MAG: hypothetical protein GF313_11370 [Caldithrix sp.]|nr:hypothetical protein [Caldithrix sp.]